MHIQYLLYNGTLPFPFVTYYFSYALWNSVTYNKVLDVKPLVPFLSEYANSLTNIWKIKVMLN